MKKKFIRFLAVVLCVLLAASFAACADTTETEKGEDETTLVKTEYNLIENGSSEYQIVVPSVSQSCEQLAASEFAYFVYEATGVQLQTITDNEAIGRDGRYISLGATALREELAPDFDESGFSYSGFAIRTVGDTVLISGSNDSRSYGTAYGVYDFLHYTIGLEFYASDEIYFNEYGPTDSVALYDLNYESIPDIQLMGFGSSLITQDSMYMRRMRLQGFYPTDYCIGPVHSTAGYFMSPSNYPDHPEWFWTFNELNGICWSSDGVVDAITQEIIAATEDSDARYVFVTQPDTEVYGCDCAECETNLQKYETESGLQLYFINRVAEKVKEYYDAVQPDKDLSLVVFCYRFTLDAPSDATFAAYPELQPKENVAASFIPIGMNFEYPITDPANAAFYEYMIDWSEIFGQKSLIVYTYGTCFSSFFDVFNDFGSVAGSLKAYSDLGVELINEQANLESNMGCFEELRIYLRSKLAWDSGRDVDALIEDFFAHYYKDASDTMLQYFNSITAYTSALFRELGLTTGIYTTVYDRIDYGTLNSLRALLDRAEEDILYLQNIDPELHETLLDRIKKEKLTVYYALLASYSSRLGDVAYQAIKSEFTEYCTKFNIVRYREGQTVDSFLETLD